MHCFILATLMSILTNTGKSVLPQANRSGTIAQSPVNVRANILPLRQQSGDPSDAILADAINSILNQLDNVIGALQQPIQMPDDFEIYDPFGNLIAAIGNIVGKDGKNYPGVFARQIWIGPGDPSNAVLFSDGFSVQIGKNGFVSVLDPFGGVGAWIGTQSDAVQNVTGAANNGSGLIRLTVTAHHLTTGDQVNVVGVGGVPNATGQWLVSVFDANHIDLINSVWAGAYTTGGTVQRFFAGAAFEQLAVGGATAITNAVDNGAGLIRLTSIAHGLQTGWFATVTGVGGVPNANGYFLVTVIDADTVDLQGSTFAGLYTKGGRIFAWAASHFRAQANGDLLISNALIRLVGAGLGSATIVLDPATGTITVSANAPSTIVTTISATGIVVGDSIAHTPAVFIESNAIAIWEDVTGLTTVGPSIRLQPNSIALFDAGGVSRVNLDGVSGVVSADSKFNAQGFNGIDITIPVVLGLTLATDTTGVVGTPGPGQSNQTVIVAASVNFGTSRTVTGGIVTA